MSRYLQQSACIFAGSAGFTSAFLRIQAVSKMMFLNLDQNSFLKGKKSESCKVPVFQPSALTKVSSSRSNLRNLDKSDKDRKTGFTITDGMDEQEE